MNFLQFDGTNFVFEIGAREKHLLFEVLKHYPMVPSSHHRITRNTEEAKMKSMQTLLEDAMAERRQETNKHLQAMLKDEARFKAAKSGFRFSLTPQQAEWLLEALNDVRVGSWIILGEPDEEKLKSVNPTETNAHYLWAMELCAYFQANLLAALDHRAPI